LVFFIASFYRHISSNLTVPFTSVGATAIDRFLRPVCYQDLPDALLPAAVRDANPLALWRLLNGELVAPQQAAEGSEPQS
jgi:NADP-dependent aldehyde dehydrogenase